MGDVTPAKCCDVQITNLRIPAEVDRPELVVRHSDAELTVLANDVWVAPLRSELQAALLNAIYTALPPRSGSAGAVRQVAMRVEVERLESEPAGYALIQVAWRLKSAEVSVACRGVGKIAVGPGVPALVQGYQQAVAQVGAQIAGSIGGIETGGTARCPGL